MSEPLLSVRDLRTYFKLDGKRGRRSRVAKAVDGVSFDVFPGETVGIVGESGCGKTVTSLSIMGLLPSPPAEVQQGSEIRFGNVDLLSVTGDVMRGIRGNDIAMIFQEPMSSLNPVFTVGTQIIETLMIHDRELSRDEARTLAIEGLAEVGITKEVIDKYPHTLSGGMRQRVMIAMALSCAPRLIIADEPTTALDVTVQAQILELLAALRKKRGMAVLLITHDLGVIAEVCDRVIVMYAGQIVESGSVHDLFASPQHPYTRGLMASLPSVEDPGRRLVAIPGTVPDPTKLPGGCRFADRCPQAAVECDAPQSLIALPAEGRSARCWRAGA